MERIEAQYKVYDQFLEITPVVPYQENSIYEIRISGLKSLDGKRSANPLYLKVVTTLSPSYCSLEGLNTLVDIYEIPEQTLLYYIREASRYADYLRDGSAANNDGSVDFAVEQFVKTKATLDVLLKVYMRKASVSGSRGTLGDVTYENANSAPDIKDLIKTLKEELKKWEDAMRGYYNEGRAKPRATKIGSKASSNNDITATTVDMILSDFSRTVAQEG